jgi:hypothetical protein
MKVEFLVNTEINDGGRFLFQLQNSKRRETMMKSLIVLRLQRMRFLRFTERMIL